jgi:hypothetical protein
MQTCPQNETKMDQNYTFLMQNTRKLISAGKSLGTCGGYYIDAELRDGSNGEGFRVAGATSVVLVLVF